MTGAQARTKSRRVVAAIPARYASTRFPGKPLAPLLGEPMIRHVVRRCREAGCFSQVLVATDDERIAAVARAAGAAVAMTRPELASGTDRVAAAAATLGLGGEDVVVNVQGDEPALPPAALVELVAAFDDAAVEMATLVRPLPPEERPRADVVKAVLSEAGDALYFSRSDIPFVRGEEPARWAHIGIYGYRARVLARLAALPPTALERAESLEQLRALGHGIRIRCRVTAARTQAVDTPADVQAAEAAIRALGAR